MSSHGEYGIDRVARSERFGRVRLDADAKVELAEKKETDGAAWINAGICFLNQEVLRAIPEGAGVSLEREVFPCWVAAVSMVT